MRAARAYLDRELHGLQYLAHGTAQKKRGSGNVIAPDITWIVLLKRRENKSAPQYRFT
jgi:hypothetical protein